jgi:hypothetical protein
MVVQDDKRESELIRLFDLEQPEKYSRSGIDAILKLEDSLIEFELKSTTKGSVSTARDFNLNHIKKLKNKHWIFGIYNEDGSALQECRYASPINMESWLNDIEQIIKEERMMVLITLKHLNISLVYDILGEKENYSFEDAKKIFKKKKLSKEDSALLIPDLDGLFSPNKILELLKIRLERCMIRGTTLNDPNIPQNYIKKLPIILDWNKAGLLNLIQTN